MITLLEWKYVLKEDRFKDIIVVVYAFVGAHHQQT
jgi:hypothetical protein